MKLTDTELLERYRKLLNRSDVCPDDCPVARTCDSDEYCSIQIEKAWRAAAGKKSSKVSSK